MKIKFISHIRKGNKTGTGFFYIPQNKEGLLYSGKRVKIDLSNRCHFFTKIAKTNDRLGIYVPRHFVIGNNLLDKRVRVQLIEAEGFCSKISPDGLIYIPKDIVGNQILKQDDIVLIRGIENDKVIKEKYSKISAHRKRNKLEYVCVFDRNFYGKEIIFQIENQKNKKYNPGMNSIAKKVLKTFNFTYINKNSIIIFDGHKIPIIINPNIDYSDLALYFGAYFADGTKRGNSWAICASTFEQARYYLKMHNFLIKESRPEFTISYTNIYNINHDNLKKDLAGVWQKEVGIIVDKFRIRKSSGKSISKWNKYGTLVIREHRQILLDFYNTLLKSLIKEILLRKDKKLAVDFICGVMEGDGCAPSKNRGHITIATNKEDTPILNSILKITKIKFKIIQEDKNKYGIRIGALEILRNFQTVKNKIFILYPKRRKIFFERLRTVGAIKFLIGNHEPTNWVKSWLQDNGLANENYKITQKGLRFGDILLSEMDKLQVE